MTPPPSSTPVKSTRPRPRPKRKIVENGLFKTVPSASFYDKQTGPSKPEPSKRRALSVVTVSDTEPEISITRVVRNPTAKQPGTTAPREDGKGKARDVGERKENPGRDDDAARKRRRETDSPLTPLPDENTTLPQIPTPPPYSPVEQPSSPIARPRVRALSIPWSEIMRVSSSPVARASSSRDVAQPEEEGNAFGLVLAPVHDDSARDANETEESDSDNEGPRTIWDLVLPIKGRKRPRAPPAAPEHEPVTDALMHSPSPLTDAITHSDSPVPPELSQISEADPAARIPAAASSAPSPADEPEQEINILLADLDLDLDLPIAGAARKHALSEEELGAFVGYVRESEARGVNDLEWLCMRYRRHVSCALLDTADLVCLYSTTLFTIYTSSATYPPRTTRCAACRGSSPALDPTRGCSACQSVHLELRALPGEWARYVFARREVVQAWEMQLLAEMESMY